MTELERHASQLETQAQNATSEERMRLQPQIDRVVTTLSQNGLRVSPSLRRINNTLKDEALDDMFDNMPV